MACPYAKKTGNLPLGWKASRWLAYGHGGPYLHLYMFHPYVSPFNLPPLLGRAGEGPLSPFNLPPLLGRAGEGPPSPFNLPPLLGRAGEGPPSPINLPPLLGRAGEGPLLFVPTNGIVPKGAPGILLGVHTTIVVWRVLHYFGFTVVSGSEGYHSVRAIHNL